MPQLANVHLRRVGPKDIVVSFALIINKGERWESGGFLAASKEYQLKGA